MTPQHFLTLAIRPALSLLPMRMNSPRAEALILAIALQESKLQHRRQMNGGPARSYLQFERNGVAGVLGHHASARIAERMCGELDIRPTVEAVYTAIEFHDVLAAIFGRLLLWTLPDSLPERGEEDAALHQYLSAWRPGRPHPEFWKANYTRAWTAIEGEHHGEGRSGSGQRSGHSG